MYLNANMMSGQTQYPLTGSQLQLASLLLQARYRQVEQVRGHLNANVLYKSIGQTPMMLDIGLTVVDKLESMHLGPAAQLVLRIHLGLLY
jgi:hypothetical protein